MDMQPFIEPEATFAKPHAHAPEDMFAFTQADAHIHDLLRAGPQRLTTVLNQAARLMPARSKRQRVAIKREVLLRLGTLIRHGQLRRIRRKFVGLPYRRFGSSSACDVRRGSTGTCPVP